MAETRCGLRSQVYQWLDFFCSSCVMSSWRKTTSKSFATRGDLMQQPLWLKYSMRLKEEEDSRKRCSKGEKTRNKNEYSTKITNYFAVKIKRRRKPTTSAPQPSNIPVSNYPLPPEPPWIGLIRLEIAELAKAS